MNIDTSPRSDNQLEENSQSIRKAAEDLIGSAHTWKKGKLYRFDLPSVNITQDSKCHVQTYGRHVNKDYWLCRESEHSMDAEHYRAIVDVLNGSQFDSTTASWSLPDRTARSTMEQNYIETLSQCKVMRQHRGWVLVNLQYELGKPLATREFNEWVYPLLPAREGSLETCYVVSLVSSDPIRDPHNHTHAIYASVERLQYDFDSNVLTWSMCTASDAGGNVPKWIQNTTIARTVAKDVPYLITWMSSRSN